MLGVDADAVRELGASDFETAVVAIGTAVEAGILATYVLVDLKIPRMWAKAITGSYGAILERVGAHRVVFPERDMGIRVAHTLTGRTIDYLPRTRPAFCARRDHRAPRGCRHGARQGRDPQQVGFDRGVRRAGQRAIYVHDARDHASRG